MSALPVVLGYRGKINLLLLWVCCPPLAAVAAQLSPGLEARLGPGYEICWLWLSGVSVLTLDTLEFLKNVRPDFVFRRAGITYLWCSELCMFAINI